jgi:hypothetical protein
VDDEAKRRAWLMARLDTEAHPYANAHPKVKPIRWGRMLGFLEVGVRFGWLTRKRAGYYSDAASGGRKPNARKLLR